MNKPYAEFILQAIRSNPVFLVGSGLSAGAGIATMGQLADDLAGSVNADGLPKADRSEWNRIRRRLTAGVMGLEEALQASESSVGDALLREIVRQTWRRISDDERRLLPSLAGGGDPTGFVRYFRMLKHSNQAVAHVITTNYDHLVEWSASSADWAVWDGFGEGAIASPLSAAELDEKMRRITSYGRKRITTRLPHLRIYKPHGSLSWFRYPDGRIRKVQGVNADLLPLLAQDGVTPAIVTPGTGKYLETHREPYGAVLAEMRAALDERRPLIILGFGFNDLHLLGSLETSLRDDSVPKIVLARGLSDNAKTLIRDRGIRNFVAVQKEGAGSRVVSDAIPSCAVPDADAWTFKALLDQAWGGEADAGAAGSV